MDGSDSNIVKLKIDPDGWTGWGTYEPVELTCIPIWSDGISDLDCRRAGTPPEWFVEDYGFIDGAFVEKKFHREITRISQIDLDDDGMKERLLNYGSGRIVREGDNKGRRVLYRSGVGTGIGRVVCKYGGLTASIPVVGKKAMGSDLPQDHMWHVALEKVSLHEQSDTHMIFEQLEKEIPEVKKFNATIDKEKVIEDAYELSGRLENYIKEWYAGRASARLPKGLLSYGIDNFKTKNWTLHHVDDPEIDEYMQWHVRPANRIDPDFKKCMVFAPDPYCTYGLCMYTGPVGAKMVIEGDFPHCRYFDIQISPPLDPNFPLTGGIGAPEVPIVDVDIDPLPGNVNPFRPGMDRNAPNRKYRFECELAIGNAHDLNPVAMDAPYYRAPMEETRKVGCFNYSGFMGDGRLLTCVIWLRYYLPDQGKGPLAGVPLPKVHFELPNGEKYWLQPDWGLSSMRVNTVIPAQETPPVEPNPIIGPGIGWLKLYGLHLIYVEVFALRAMGLFKKGSWELARKLIPEWDRVLWGRGPDAPKPGCFEISATTCTNNNFLARVMSLGKGKIVVVSGKLPTFPKTRNGEATLTPAQVRYWSFTRLHETPDFAFPGIALGQLHDEEVVIDGDRRYVLALSRAGDRPVNAVPETGVTWQDWGPDSIQYLLIRWMSVAPEHVDAEIVPNDVNIPWKKGGISQPEYDASLVGLNKPGFLKEYHPIIHYMSKEEFEALGSKITPELLPEWK